MTPLPSSISALIFDLGGVIVDLNVNKTIQAFSELSGLTHAAISEAYITHPEFQMYERGELTDSEFRSMLRSIFSIHVHDELLDKAWNAMITDIPKRKLAMAAALKNNFHVVVLSNTNNIHIRYVNALLAGSTLDSYFHRCYYSHEVGMRKPESRIYEHTLRDIGVSPEAAFFLDDNIENIMAASALGIHTFHVTSPERVYEVFKEFI